MLYVALYVLCYKRAIESAQKRREVVEGQAEVAAGAARQGVDGVARGSLERVPIEPSIEGVGEGA